MNRPDAKTVLMFALSADAFVEDERLSAESGMNGHFAKPVDFAALPETPKIQPVSAKAEAILCLRICVIFVVLSYTVKWEC